MILEELQKCVKDAVLSWVNSNQINLPEKKKLKQLCNKDKYIALNEITTIQCNQLDHVLAYKALKKILYATSFFNFISDHKSIIARIGLKKNEFSKQFLENLHFDSEKHMKENKKKQNIVDDENIENNENKQAIENIKEGTWVEATTINEYGRLITEQFKESIFVFSTHFYEKLIKHGYEAVRRW